MRIQTRHSTRPKVPEVVLVLALAIVVEPAWALEVVLVIEVAVFALEEEVGNAASWKGAPSTSA